MFYTVIGWAGLMIAAAIPLTIWCATCAYMFDIFDMANDMRRRREGDARRRSAMRLP